MNEPFFSGLVRQFCVVSIVGSCLEMATNDLAWGTVDRGCYEPTGIFIEIHCNGDVMIIGVFGRLETCRNVMIDKNVAGLRGLHRARQWWIVWGMAMSGRCR